MATKSRRPPPMTPKAVAMATPKRKNGKNAQQALLDNFDLEMEHRTRDMRNNLENALSAFMALVDADLLKIPRTMLSMTMGDLDDAWAGSFADTHMALAKKQFSNQHPERDEADVVAAAKRKRAQSPSTPARVSKNPRKAVVTPAVGAKRRTTTKRTKVVLPASTGNSTLPQDHVFNPHLPKTPKLPRAPKRNESFFSANGSPVAVDAETDEEDLEDDDDELPDPEEMERAALHPKSRKPKRAHSILFRQGLGGAPSSDDEGTEIHIPLSDGRIISFDPARLEAGKIDAELAQGGLGSAEKKKVKQRVQEEVVKALTARVAEWNALKD